MQASSRSQQASPAASKAALEDCSVWFPCPAWVGTIFAYRGFVLRGVTTPPAFRKEVPPRCGGKLRPGGPTLGTRSLGRR